MYIERRFWEKFRVVIFINLTTESANNNNPAIIVVTLKTFFASTIYFFN